MNGAASRGANPVATALAILGFALAALSIWGGIAGSPGLFAAAALFILLAILGLSSVRMANQWEKAVVLRLGRLHAIRGPGLFLVVPVIDAVVSWVDQRIQTTEFTAEQALTKDTVPVNVDAIIFWQAHDAEKASLKIADYRQAIARVSQTSLREMIGSTPLTALLSQRRAADSRLKDEIGGKTADWGVSVLSVEIRDVTIPMALQDAMSRQAQAEREREARVILGNSEREIAEKFVDAAEIYARNPAAFQLRAMNIIYETTKERGATILMPSAMVDAMNPATIAALATALAQKPPQG